MEEKYTLAEARQKIAEEDCLRHGHELNQMLTASGATVRVVCERCGTAWALVETRQS
jgi:hypothetical protein